MFDRPDSPSDLPPSARNVIEVLHEADGPLTQRELAERTYFQQPTISTAINDLVERGYVSAVDAMRTGEPGRPPRLYDLQDTE